MVGAIGAAAGAILRAGRSAGGDLRTAIQRAAAAAGAGPAATAPPGPLNQEPREPGSLHSHQELRDEQRDLQERVMRQMIKGLIAAVAVMVTAPAMACGFNPCGYSAPVVNYGCGGCGGYGYGYGGYGAVERLPEDRKS